MKKMMTTGLLLLTVLTCGVVRADDNAELARGKYLVKVGGCNDCHTPGWPQSAGKIPEMDWLTGSSVAFAGPWGATYPANLRLKLHDMDESEWLTYARKERRPPMPWFNLAAMSTGDLKAMYKFIRGLGSKGKPAPDFVPPGQAIQTPYIDFVPKNLPPQTAQTGK